MKFITSGNASEVLKPREETFNLPSASIATKRPAILRCGFDSVNFMRCNKFYSPSSKSLIEGVTVIRKIPNNSLRCGASDASGESVFDKGDFMWASRSRVDGDRKTSAVCHCHELRTLAALGFSNSGAPFFATTKVASMKHSASLNLPRFSRSWARVSRM